LFDLAAEGLIRLYPHRGGEVRELTAEDLNEIYSIREILERHAIGLVIERMEDGSLDRPQAIYKRMLTERNPVKWVDLNREFHLAIYEAARSPRLMSILRSLMDAGVMYVGASIRREPGLRTAATKGHADILAALKARDVNAATKVILDHMKQTIRVAMTSIPR
jgi:DNA-binding GntR family transcriptional regulator